MGLAWLVAEVILGVAAAGAVTGVVVGLATRWSVEVGPLAPSAVTVACVVGAILLGERIRGRNSE